MKKINEWLDEPIVVLTSDSHKPRYSSNYYYTENEIKKFKSKETNQIKINVNTRRNDANNIFCELVDYSMQYNINDIDHTPLFKPSIKNSFYDFIYTNSVK